MQPQQPYGPPQDGQRGQDPYGQPYPPYGPTPGPADPPDRAPAGNAPQPQYPGHTNQSFHQPQSTPYNGLAMPYDEGAAMPQAGQAWQPGRQSAQPYPAGPNQPAMPQYQPPAGYNDQNKHRNQIPAMPEVPRHKTPYDFFMLQRHPMNTKYPMGTPKKASLATKVVWVAGAAIGLMAIIGLVSALTPKDTTGDELFSLAQAQQEVIRICSQGSTKTKLQVNRNFSATCTASMTTDQYRLLNYMAKAGYKYNSKNLGGLTNSQNDSELNAATAASDYDGTFKNVSERILTNYGNRLQQELAAPKLGTNGQSLLQSAVENNKLLIELVQIQTTDTTAATGD